MEHPCIHDIGTPRRFVATGRRLIAGAVLGTVGVAWSQTSPPASAPLDATPLAIATLSGATASATPTPTPTPTPLASGAAVPATSEVDAAAPPPARPPLALQASLAALRARLRPTPDSRAVNGGGVMLHPGLDIKVIELPREGAPIGPPPKRAHHALSIGMEGPKQMLRGLGLDATECAARFRMPSKLSKRSDGSAQVDVMAQLGMGCKF